MKAIKPLLILCLALGFAACKKNELDMTVVQKTVLEGNTLGQFRVNDAWEVAIVYDSVDSFVELEYSAYLEDYVSVREADEWLSVGFTGKIYPVAGSVYKTTIHTSERRFLRISADNASVVAMEGRFELEEGIDIDLRNATVCSGLDVSAPSCSISLTKDSQLLGVQYDGATCSLSVSTGSSCKGIFNVGQSFNADAENQSQLIVFGGSMPSATLKVNGASTVNMAQAEVEDMEVHLDGASEATVNVANTLGGFVLSASTLYYKGNPQIDVECSDDSQLIPF